MNTVIVMPVMNGQLSSHFGGCEAFAFVTVENDTITETRMLQPPDHSPGAFPEWIHQNGGKIVIASGIGQRAVDIFQQQGIEVLMGVCPAPVEEIVKQYLTRSLETGQEACSGHHLHGHHH